MLFKDVFRLCIVYIMRPLAMLSKVAVVKHVVSTDMHSTALFPLVPISATTLNIVELAHFWEHL